jgi:hypothetical protein
LVYFSKEGSRILVGMNGENVPNPLFPGYDLSDDLDKQAPSAVRGLRMDPEPAAFALSIVRRSRVASAPRSATRVRGELAYIETHGPLLSVERGWVREDWLGPDSYVVVGAARSGPYAGVRPNIMTSTDGDHYACITKGECGERVLLDGKLAAPAYDAIFHPAFVGNSEFAHLVIRDAQVYRVSYPVPELR